jgi:hypothetical protein
MNLLKSKRVLGAGFAVLVLFFGGLFFFLNRQVSQPDTDYMVAQQNLPTVSPEDIGMVVTVRSDKRAVMFELTKAENIKHVDYEIRYTHDVDGERVTEGLLGEMNIAEDGITKTDFRPFGTCSASVCRYDKDISDVLIVLKLDMKDGKSYQVQKNVDL